MPDPSSPDCASSVSSVTIPRSPAPNEPSHPTMQPTIQLPAPPAAPSSPRSARGVQFSPMPAAAAASSSIDMSATLPHRNTHQSHRSDQSLGLGLGLLRRRMTRAQTFRTVETLDADDEDDEGRAWEPGSEPTTDRDKWPMAWCHVTVVEFSQQRERVTEYNNKSFLKFLAKPQEDWVTCRWITVNGLSRDIIEAVGQKYDLHELALEDLVWTRNRTKAEWYPNHAFIVLTMQTILGFGEEESDAFPDDRNNTLGAQSAKRGLKHLWHTWRQPVQDMFDKEMPDVPDRVHAGIPQGYDPPRPRKTLQAYHSWQNKARTRYMESVSSLLPHCMVMAEQVSLFLTSDNTVISFFENSSHVIERQLVTRIRNRGTILREYCDASLVCQAIIDNIVDLAIPLTQRYAQVIDEIELGVLIKPDIEQTTRLYICISEINKMLVFLNPIDNMVNVIRDHKADMPQKEALDLLQRGDSGVIITPMTAMYLADVLDHCIIVTEAMEQLKQSAENLINLIFNKTSAIQNQSMQALTIVTIIFLPMTFITGFFGQNFVVFPELEHGISYFWKVAIPTGVVTAIIVMWTHIVAWVRAHVQQRDVKDMRRHSKHNRKLLHEAQRTATLHGRGLAVQ